jgi:hypothetical protein
METQFDGFPTIDDITSDDERDAEQAYWQTLRAADDYADYVERMAVSMADEMDEEDGGDEPPTPPSAPAVVVRPAPRPLWAVLLSGSGGHVAQTRAEARAERRRRRAELDRAA